jgi:hypothetical protein
MAKLTIEIDMDDSQDTWDALYRQIEEFGTDAGEATPKPSPNPTASPATYDLLLDPERAFGDVGDFYAVLTGRE